METTHLMTCLSKNHETWLKMARSFSYDYPEDLVQDMYIQIYNWAQRHPESSIVYNTEGDLNTFFVYKVIKSLFLQSIKKNIETVDIDEIELILNEPDDSAVSERLAKLHWYDRKVFEYVYIKNISMLQLSEMTGIKYDSIKRTIKKAKCILRSET